MPPVRIWRVGQLVLRVARQVRVRHRRDGGVPLEERGQRERRLRLLAGAHAERADAADGVPRVEGRRLGAHRGLPRPDRVDELGASRPPHRAGRRCGRRVPLVAACSTRSTPWSSGRCTVGPAKVESTTVIGPADGADRRRGRPARAPGWPASPRTRPASCPGRMAAAMASASVPSTKVTSMPNRGRCITMQAVGDREDLARRHDVVARRAQAHEHRRHRAHARTRPPAPPRRPRARRRRPRSRARWGCRSGSRSAVERGAPTMAACSATSSTE